MDVGLIVGNVGYLAALFAGLSALALAVQLGEPPVTDKNKKKSESASRSKQKQPSHQIANPDQDVTFNAEGKLVANEMTSDQELSLSDLRKTFVDGFSGPRSKYDIALTILHEIQSDAGGTMDGGSTIAAEAYLDATHSIIFSEQSDSLKALTSSPDALHPAARSEGKEQAKAPGKQGMSKPSKSSIKKPTPRKTRSDASDPEQE